VSIGVEKLVGHYYTPIDSSWCYRLNLAGPSKYSTMTLRYRLSASFTCATESILSAPGMVSAHYRRR